MTAVKAILTDIEGTVSSISFVRDVLFPYARAHLPAFLQAQGDTPEIAALLAETRTLAGLDAQASLETVAATLQGWIDEDRKAPPLKALQGLIWRGGYDSGALVADVYPDAVAALRTWAAAGLPIYVYSSGSVEAQHLFFAHTQAGNLLPLFSGHFDTRTGPKTDAASYRAIAAATGIAAENTLFLSDSGAELDAARAAGMQAVGVVRPGNAPLTGTSPVQTVTTFEALAVV